MDPSACKVIYIDDRFNTERWISREGSSKPLSPQQPAQGQADFNELPVDLQTNVNAFLSVFNQVYVCNSGRSFSTKLSELHDSVSVKLDCTPIIACFDVGSELREDNYFRPRHQARFNPTADSPLPSPIALRREITFSSESDESYGLQLLSRIAADLQVEEGVKRIIPVAIVQPKQRKDSYDQALEQTRAPAIARSPYGSETVPARVVDTSDSIAPQMMLQCLDAGALDVVKSPLDKAGIMGLTVHAYRIYKAAKKEQAGFMASARTRKQSWVGVDEEQPYAYLREAMVRKLLKGICEPETVIEDFQHRGLYVEESRKDVIAREVGSWGFCGHDFNEDELVYAGYCMLNHALQMPDLEKWRISEDQLLHFMQGCRVAYNSFVLYHNFRHAVDVLQSLFYFLVQIGTVPSYPTGSPPPPKSEAKSAVANLLGPFEALTLLVSAIGHDVGHPGVNNMFLVKLNAPLAQLYNDQSVLEAFHCAAYSQILRRHWPVAFNDKGLRKLMISSILATDMGVHSDYMQQLGQLQEKIHESKTTDSWTPKDMEAYRVLTCGLLIKCADISNVARPWSVAEKWTHLLQKEFAHQGEMESAVGMETTLFGGPPELGNMLKLANGQIGFMTIFAHPLFANVSDIVPAMKFAADEILTNKGVWFTRAEQEKRREQLRRESGHTEGGAISPRSQSPIGGNRKSLPVSKEKEGAPHLSPLSNPPDSPTEHRDAATALPGMKSGADSPSQSRRSSLAAVAGMATSGGDGTTSRRSSGASKPALKAPRRPSPENRRSNNSTNSQRQVTTGDRSESPRKVSSEVEDPKKELGKSDVSNMPTAKEQDYVGGQGLDGAADGRRDEGTSMRAGSEYVPVLSPDPHPNYKERSASPLAKFSFATSDAKEPTRVYDPAQHYPPLHAGARASVPVNNIHGSRSGEPVHQSTSNTSTTPGAAGGAYSTTTDATSLASGDGEERVSMETAAQRSEFEARRKRAESAPMQVGSGLGSQRSLGGLSSGSRGSSKNEYRVNGEIVDEREASKGSGGTMRKRSRIRLAILKGVGLRKSDSEEGQVHGNPF